MNILKKRERKRKKRKMVAQYNQQLKLFASCIFLKGKNIFFFRWVESPFSCRTIKPFRLLLLPFHSSFSTYTITTKDQVFFSFCILCGYENLSQDRRKARTETLNRLQMRLHEVFGEKVTIGKKKMVKVLNLKEL